MGVALRISVDRQKIVLFYEMVFISAVTYSAAAEPMTTANKPSDEECTQVEEKNATGEDLTPDEGNLLFACFMRNKRYNRDGWQAYQSPPDLYDLQGFRHIPGVLGNSGL